jgi:secreted trypsin-like serine protease
MILRRENPGRNAARLAGGLTLALLLCGRPDTAQAVLRRDDVPLSSYQKLGQGPQFAGVGMIEIDYGDGYAPFASATLIAPNYILCAGHVFDGGALTGAQGVEFIVGGVSIPILFKRAGVVHLGPGYMNNPVTGVVANDISVVRLSQNSTETPAAVYSGRSERGKTGTLVGFGDSGTGLTGDEENTAKLAGQNVLDVVTKTVIETDFDSPHTRTTNVFGSAIPTALEAQLGPGDSGGSLWIKVNGQWAVAGVSSFGEQGRGKLTFDSLGNPIEDYYGWVSGYTRVSNYLAFLKKYVNVRMVSDLAPAQADDKMGPGQRVSLRARTGRPGP